MTELRKVVEEMRARAKALREYVENICDLPGYIAEADKLDDWANRIESEQQRAESLAAENARLNAIINTPHTDDFWKAASIEAEHQVQRWSTSHDAGKTAPDWFWLVGYLAGKALHAALTGNTDKALHHVVTTAAACANWFRAMKGATDMRPGIDGEAELAAQGQEVSRG